MTFTVDGLDSNLVAAALSAEHGIGVRAGKFCAHLLVDALLEEDGDDEPHATAVRVSAGLATTEEHVERLLAGGRRCSPPRVRAPTTTSSTATAGSRSTTRARSTALVALARGTASGDSPHARLAPPASRVQAGSLRS